jgi:WD40 repeat protein
VRWNPLTDETFSFLRVSAYVGDFAISGDERWAAIVSSGSVIRVWDLSGTKTPTRATCRFQAVGPGRGRIWCVVLSACGEFLAYQRSGADFCVGDVRTRSVWRLPESFPITTRQAAFHPSQPILACCLHRGEVVFYDVARQTEAKRYTWKIDSTDVIAFSPDGLRCAVANKHKIIIWDTDD